MKILVVSVKDRALDAYGNPFYVHALGQAIRSFSDEINRNAPDNTMYNHAGDYDLYHLGTYDNDTGTFENEERPIQIAIGKNLKIHQEAPNLKL